MIIETNTRTEKGQSLVIIALIMVALLAMLAFALDGGNTYFQRRNAQNAADAAAIAGADAYCKDENYTAGYTAALNYASINGFELPVTNFNIVNEPVSQINVRTTGTFDTFFAGVIGRPEMTVEAEASASCCVPKGADHIMPIAWACHHPSAFLSEGATTLDDCVAQVISEDKLNDYTDGDGDPPYPYQKDSGKDYEFYKELYIVMDSDPTSTDVNETCIYLDSGGNPIPNPDTGVMGTLDCDFDNDGENDFLANGDRSWVDLDGGGGGANDLRRWVTQGLNFPLELPVWVKGEPGVTGSTFHDVDTLKNNYFLIPVFDGMCKGDPTSCTDVYDGEPIIDFSNNKYTYRLVTFAAFYVTCVNDNPGDKCPGHEYLKDNDLIKNDSVKTIEGYFVNKDVSGNNESDCTGDGINFGAEVIRLTR